MGGADDKPVWERIAELGFADAVERKGFERVNATHWKMEGEGLTWRVRLVRGYRATPTSFLPVHGALVHGLDELYAKWDGSKASEYLHGAGQHVHMQSDTGADVVRAQRLEYERLYPRSKFYGGWLGLARELLEHFRILRTRPVFARDFLKIQYWGSASEGLRAKAFLTEGHDLDEVTRVVTDYWERYSWPWIKARLCFQDLYHLNWAVDRHRYGAVLPFNLAVAKLACDQSFIDSLANKKFSEMHSAARTAARLGFEPDDVATLHVIRQVSTKRDKAIVNLVGHLSEVRMLVAISHALDLGVPKPDIDLRPFDAYILRNYGSDAPVISH